MQQNRARMCYTCDRWSWSLMMRASAARPAAGGMATMPSRFSRAMVPCTRVRQAHSNLRFLAHHESLATKTMMKWAEPQGAQMPRRLA